MVGHVERLDGVTPPKGVEGAGVREGLRQVGGALLGGLLSGAVGAYCYYDPLLRPLSHTFGLWLAVVILVTARRPWRLAVLNAAAALEAAVIAFYVGKKVMYAIRYPGQPYSINGPQVFLWVLLALIAGIGLGLVLHQLGGVGRGAVAAAAVAAGLLVADALHRGMIYYGDISVLVVATAVWLLVLALVVRQSPRREVLCAALLAVPATVVSVALISAPDLVEQLVFVGS